MEIKQGKNILSLTSIRYNHWSPVRQIKIKNLKTSNTYKTTGKRRTYGMIDTLLDAITLAILIVIGGIHINPGPTQNLKPQLQIITQNARGLIEAKKKNFLTNVMSYSKTLHRHSCCTGRW